MRSRCRPQVRSRGKMVRNSYNRMVRHFAYIQGSLHWEDWNFRTISQRSAELLVSLGEAERVTRQTHTTLTLKSGGSSIVACVETVGYRALTPTRWEQPSPCTLTFSTMTAVAKRALCLVDDKLTRAEEAANIKFILWPLVGDTKATAVRPRVSPAEMRLAQSLMLTGRLAA